MVYTTPDAVFLDVPLISWLMVTHNRAVHVVKSITSYAAWRFQYIKDLGKVEIPK